MSDECGCWGVPSWYARARCAHAAFPGARGCRVTARCLRQRSGRLTGGDDSGFPLLFPRSISSTPAAEVAFMSADSVNHAAVQVAATH